MKRASGRGNFDPGLTDCAEALKRNDPQAFYLMAVLLNDDGDSAKALEIARHGLQIAQTKKEPEVVDLLAEFISQMNIDDTQDLHLHGRDHCTPTDNPFAVLDPEARQLSQASSQAMDSLNKAKELKTFQPIQPKEDLSYPFSPGNYAFSLVCSKCYVQEKPGENGVVEKPNLKHSCEHNVLIVRKGASKWIKIRPRSKQVYFRGEYQLCFHYKKSMPCSHTNCTFAHSKEEMDFWTMDKNDQFSIETFIHDQLNLLDTTPRFIKPKIKDPTSASLKTEGRSSTIFSAPLKSKASSVTKVNGSLKSPPPPKVTPTQNSASSFPLAGSHDFMIACNVCTIPQKAPNYKSLVVVQKLNHLCSQNILLTRPKQWKNELWNFIRPRASHRRFKGQYQACNIKGCAFNNCSYAHCDEERMLWSFEKDGLFCLEDFIMSNRAQPNLRKMTLADIFRMYPGSFQFLCKLCFFGSKCLLSQEKQGRCALGHAWEENKMLFYMDQKKRTPIMPMPLCGPNAFFKLCYRRQYCNRYYSGRCNNAHTEAERDVWRMIRDGQGTYDDLVQQGKGRPSAAPVTASKAPSCPYRIIEICSPCLSDGVLSGPNDKHQNCTNKKGHQWQGNGIFLLMPERKMIKELPKHIPVGSRFTICWDVLSKSRKCMRGRKCQFAHSEEEVKVWKWMIQNKVSKVSSLLKRKSVQQPATNGKDHSQVPSSSAEVTSVKHSVPATSESQQDEAVHFCFFCSVECASSAEYEQHCISDEHLDNVASDEDHQWNFRPPPPFGKSKPRLCPKEFCAYGGSVHNFCPYAHSKEELEEWKERIEWRKMKKERAEEGGVAQYTLSLLKEYEQSKQAIEVLSESVADIEIKVSAPLHAVMDDKDSTQTWNFSIISKGGKPLEHVALLYDKDRRHFKLEHESMQSHYDIDGKKLLTSSSSGLLEYTVSVVFEGGLLGSFNQWIICDFGERPCAVRKLNVDLFSEETQQLVLEMRDEVKMDRWTSENKIIKPFRTLSKVAEELHLKYRAPTSAVDVVTNDLVGSELNQHNYVQRMHKMLFLEELSQVKLIASYNLRTKIELLSKISEKTFVQARTGQLFAKVLLKRVLNEDTDAGYLLLTSVQSAYLKPHSTNSQSIYEADVLNKMDHDFDGKGRDYIYLCLSDVCVQELALVSGDILQVDIQFQINREIFVQMHQALDLLKSTDTVFPSLSSAQPQLPVNVRASDTLNVSQQKILMHVLRGQGGPPLLVYGPFGTGKTESLAQSVMALAKLQPLSRILICTHSNSAADLYITRHFRHHDDISVCRIYHEGRWIKTVPHEVLPFCFQSDDHMRFVMPSKRDVAAHQVVIITLMTASYLTKALQLHGHFTHIMIDEAAQALECEAIMPLLLADSKTCVALAGDPMQMTPRVFSVQAKRERLDRSLLERLFELYLKREKNEGSGVSPAVLLKENYRTDAALLRFISAAYYGGPNELIPRAPNYHTNFPSMIFYAVKGKEVIDADGTSFYNHAEIQEVVDQVAFLFNHWPPEWGSVSAEKIGVISPYYSQVVRIRDALRAHRYLRGVKVETVANVQGKEFQAVFISTVRSAHPSLGGASNLGFLSDHRLLNTALTRTKTFLGVIGDPVALCAVGNCKVLWREFLGSSVIFPQTYNMTVIYNQVQIFNQTARSETPPSFLSNDAESNDEEDSNVAILSTATLDDLSILDNLPKPRHVLLHLTRESAPTHHQDEVSLSNADVTVHAGHAVVTFSTKLQAREGHPETQEWVRERIASEPLKYVQCLVLQNGTQGLVLHSQNPTSLVHLRASLDCPVLAGDEVGVELQQDPDQKPVGRVLCVLHRSLDLCGQLVVCSQGKQPGSLQPLHPDMPAIHVVLPDKRLDRVLKGSFPVYEYTKSGGVAFTRYEPNSHALWLVHCLGWLRGLAVGLVLHPLPSSPDIGHSLHALHLAWQVPEKFMESTLEELPQAPAAAGDRFDYCGIQTFCIQDPVDKAIDLAISLVPVQDLFLIGVHVADVAQVVPLGSAMDREAAVRAALQHCPLQSHGLMLPEKLTYEQCSFLPGQNRPAITVFITINGNADIIKITPKRTLVSCNQVLSAEDVQNIINGKQQSEFKTSLDQLRMATRAWCMKRLGNASFCKQGPPAIQILNEVKITANTMMAKLMIKRLPDCCPLLVQAAPNDTALDAWKERHRGAIQNSLHLSRLCHEDLCLCQGPCTAIKSHERASPVKIAKDDWQLLQEGLLSPRSPSLLPQVMVAESALNRIRQPQRPICSSLVPKGAMLNHSLNQPIHVSFTAPLHSYLDLVTQRVLISVIGKNPSPYSERQVQELCTAANAARRKVQLHQKACEQLLLCRKINKIPNCLSAVVEGVDEARLHVFSRGSFDETVPLHSLGVNSVARNEAGDIQLSWKFCFADINLQGDTLQEVELSMDWNVVQIQSDVWQQLMRTPQDFPEVKEHEPPLLPLSPSDPSASSLSLTLPVGTVMSLQIAAGMNRGLLRPRLQLINLSPSFCLCVEHHLYAEECFGPSKVGSLNDTSLVDVVAYDRLWRSRIAAAAVEVSQSACQTTIINGIRIQWKTKGEASFALPPSFCKSRVISFRGSISQGSPGFVCVRYHGLQDSTDFKAYTWVGHCLLHKVVATDDGSELVHLKLNQHSYPLPTAANQLPATIEWIPKHPVLRASEQVLDKVHQASSLAKDIVINRVPGRLKYEYLSSFDKKSFIWLPLLNTEQDSVLTQCLEKAFMCVNGTAMSGKSLIAYHLAACFAFTNQKANDPAAVLLCVPSDDHIKKCMDIFADSLLDVAPLYENKLDQQRNTNAAIYIATVNTSSYAPNIHQVIIDDCHMIMEPNVFRAILHPNCMHVVLFGDLLAQMPFNGSKYMQMSLFQRYKKKHIQLKCAPFSMHYALSRFPSTKFDLPLKPAGEQKPPVKILQRSYPCVFLPLSGQEESVLVEEQGHTQLSLVNASEVKEAVHIARQLVLRFKVSEEKIAILTPYEAQVNAIREQCSMKDVSVRSIACSAGRSWDYVILSWVRSANSWVIPEQVDWQEEHIGLSADSGVMYTALTRAQKGIIHIGDRKTLSPHSVWHELLEEYDQHKLIMSVSEFLSSK